MTSAPETATLTGADPQVGDSVGQVVADIRADGRHASAVSVLERAVAPIVEDMGFELLLLEWTGGGKRRIMRLFVDHLGAGAEGVSVGDCSRLSRIVGNTLDAQEAAASEGAEPGESDEPPALPMDPALLGLLRLPYVLEVSSPGIDRPLTKRHHFEAQVGGRVKLETYAPLEPECFTPAPAELRPERKFQGRISAVAADDAAPSDPRRGFVTIDDAAGARTIRVPLPRVRRANLVWEG